MYKIKVRYVNIMHNNSLFLHIYLCLFNYSLLFFFHGSEGYTSNLFLIKLHNQFNKSKAHSHRSQARFHAEKVNNSSVK
jgi:hypothetical protein